MPCTLALRLEQLDGIAVRILNLDLPAARTDFPRIAEVQPSSLQRLNERRCELLDASIELQSAPGQGTTFRVIFPRRYLSVTT
jgi:hypothetical protein